MQVLGTRNKSNKSILHQGIVKLNIRKSFFKEMMCNTGIHWLDCSISEIGGLQDKSEHLSVKALGAAGEGLPSHTSEPLSLSSQLR